MSYEVPAAQSDIAQAKAEFWGDLQVDYYTQTSVLFLANQTLETVLSTNGRKAHKPILSQPAIRDYTPHGTLTYDKKKAEKQTLEVDTFPTAAEVVDITESMQNPYDLNAHSLKAIRMGLINRTEQVFTSKLDDAAHAIDNGSAVALSTTNVGDIIEEADGTLGAFDIPVETAMRALVVGPRTLALLRKARSDKETPLGDRTDSSGIVGPWRGWTVVANNNLPFTAKLGLATQPTDGDSITIMGRKLEFRDVLATATDANSTGIKIGGNVAATRTNLSNFFSRGGTEGTDYSQPDNVTSFILRDKRRIRMTTAADMVLTGFGDITLVDSLTDTTDGWKDARQTSGFMMRGAIDLVMQFMRQRTLEDKDLFADYNSGIIGVGAEMFQDGALATVRVNQNVDAWIN